MRSHFLSASAVSVVTTIAFCLTCAPSTQAAAEDVAGKESATNLTVAPATLAADSISPSAPSASSSLGTPVTDSLPDAPAPAALADPATGLTGMTAPKYARVIPAGETAERLGPGDKVVLGLRSVVSINSIAEVLIGAGYAQLTNGQPNYGVSRVPFAQRFGAGVARSASEDIFTMSILAPVLHQDPRYYVLGPDARFLKRVVYAATRPLITRTDSGRHTLNASLLIGYAGAAALTHTYYPTINRNFTDEARTFGTSIGGTAISFVFDEFRDQILSAVHHKH